MVGSIDDSGESGDTRDDGGYNSKICAKQRKILLNSLTPPKYTDLVVFNAKDE